MFTSRLIPLMLSALVLASCGATPSSVAPAIGAASPTGDLPPTAEMEQLLKEVNAVRGSARVCGGQKPEEAPENVAATTPVTWNAQLTAAAQAHAQDMARRNYVAHDSPEGGKLEHRVEAAGYVNWREVGENIAAGFTASEVIQGWLDSKPHCLTLMDSAWKEVGISMVAAPSKDNEYANYWVQNFGTR